MVKSSSIKSLHVCFVLSTGTGRKGHKEIYSLLKDIALLSASCDLTDSVIEPG